MSIWYAIKLLIYRFLTGDDDPIWYQDYLGKRIAQKSARFLRAELKRDKKTPQ
jgi:hypothetical protein